jgi:transcriptional regulator with XRE-family HTH domain
MEIDHFGEKFRLARKELGLTQAELADKCKLNIRTIQRIENGAVVPRFYTINIINDVLGTEYMLPLEDTLEDNNLDEYREIFRRRKRFRLATAYSAIILMVAVVLIGFPDWVIFGMPKLTWAPYFYLIIFADLIGIGFTWRCPGCNALLGDVTNTRYCSSCGLDFNAYEGKK